MLVGYKSWEKSQEPHHKILCTLEVIHVIYYNPMHVDWHPKIILILLAVFLEQIKTLNVNGCDVVLQCLRDSKLGQICSIKVGFSEH